MRKSFEEPLFQVGDGVRLKRCPLIHGEVIFVSGNSDKWVYEIKVRDFGHWKLYRYNEDELMI